MTLERLWAGWRSEYVSAATAAGPDGNQPGGGDQPGSVFTRILASGLPDEDTYVVHRGEHTFAILNLYPYGTGHVLVLPYREVGQLDELEPDESAELWATTVSAVAAIRAAYRPDGVNVGMNLGEAAGAGIPEHVHVHVLPRWAADSNFMTAVAETRVLPEALPTTWQKLRDSWPRT